MAIKTYSAKKVIRPIANLFFNYSFCCSWFIISNGTDHFKDLPEGVNEIITSLSTNNTQAVIFGNKNIVNNFDNKNFVYIFDKIFIVMKNIVGPPARKEGFYQRNWEVEKVLDRIDAGNNIQIAAPRRVGKTSILFHLLDNKINDYIYVYVDTESCR